jgi:hypothetical protein
MWCPEPVTSGRPRKYIARPTLPKYPALVTVSDEEARQISDLLDLLFEVEEWMDTDLPPVQKGSAFAGDDAKTHPYEVSHAVNNSLNIAVDHLHCMRMALTGRGPRTIDLHAYAPFTLLRGALENASTAVWIASPPRRADRIVRRARYESSNIQAAEDMLKAVGEPASSVAEERKILLQDVATKAGVDLASVAKKVGYSEITKDAGDFADLREGDRQLAFLFWKMCSAVAHGDRWALAFLDIQKLSDGSEGVSRTRITAPAHIVLSGTRGALAMIKIGRRLWKQRSQLHLGPVTPVAA